MFRFLYSVNLVPEPVGGFVVTFPDFPEAITQGENVSDSLKQAADCLEEAVAGRIRRGQTIPIPGPIAESGFSVSLSALFSAKAALYLKMKSDHVSSSDGI
ncbi:MAG: type II toxin-antitoxin system HicB family antitoxin [Acidobacteria bacterium]|nr:type II toxin-antitoxin system HicB family antitoxin [Acidobacteriota bacterium]